MTNSNPALDAVLAAAQRAQDQAARGRTAASDAISGAITETERGADARTASGESGAGAVERTGALKVQREDYLHRVGMNLGTVQDSENEILLGLATQRREALMAGVAADEEVSKLKSVGVLDNPLSWLVNSLKLPEAEDRQRRARSASASAGNAMEETRKSATDARVAIDATARTTDAGAIAAEAQQIRDRAAAEAATTKAQAYFYRAQQVESDRNYTAAELAAANATYTAQNTEKSIQMQAAGLEETRRFHREQREAKMAETVGDENWYTGYKEQVGAVAASIGQVVDMPKDFAGYRRVVQNVKGYREDIERLYDLSTGLKVSGRVIFGSTPSVAMATKAITGAVTPPEMKPATDILEATWKELSSPEGLLKPDGTPAVRKVGTIASRYVFTPDMKPEERAALYNEAVAVKQSLTPRTFVPIGVVRKLVPDVENNPVIVALKASGLDTGPDGVLAVGSTSKIAELAVAAYAKGGSGLTLDTLSRGLAELGELTVRYTNQQHGYKALGLEEAKFVPATVNGETVSVNQPLELLKAAMAARFKAVGMNRAGEVTTLRAPWSASGRIRAPLTTDQMKYSEEAAWLAGAEAAAAKSRKAKE